MQTLHIGLLGCGNVGSALVSLLEEQRQEIATRTNLELQITRIAVKSLEKDRGIAVNPRILGADASSVVEDPDVDIVVELIGDIEPARSLLHVAIEAGKPVVTANKQLLANHGVELFAAADRVGVDLLFEAAVAGAIPLMRPLRESLTGEHIQRVMGIVNGTTNYILTQMTEQKTTYAEALEEAQKLGYAESDPTADIEGFDAGAKAAIIASMTFGAVVVASDVHHEGISKITPHEIELARRFGYVVKPIVIIERIEEDTDTRILGTASKPDKLEIALRVHPVMLPKQHPLAAVRDNFNAVFVESTAIGELMFYGLGAGGLPTAGAVLGDIIDASINLTRGRQPSRIGRLVQPVIHPIDSLESAYLIGLEAVDQPGVLASIADVFGQNHVSIRSMEQHGVGAEAQIVFITHRCKERNVQTTLQRLRSLSVVHNLKSIMRVIDD